MAAASFLEHVGLAHAVHEIYALESTPTRYAKRRNEARGILQRIAARNGTDMIGLITRSVPREAGGSAVERISKAHARRMERMMVDGDRLAPDVFRELYMKQPLLAPLCESIVWGAFGKGDALQATFRPEGGKRKDAKGKEVRPGKGSRVGVVHPVELEAAGSLDTWKEAAKKVRQPFLQLERPVYQLTKKQSESNEIQDFRRYTRDWLHELGWWGYKEDMDYMADVDSFSVSMARDKKQIDAKLGSDGRVHTIGMGRLSLDYSLEKRDHFAKPHDETPFGKLHPVSQSELLYAFKGPGGRDRPAPRDRAAARGRTARQAPSGASTGTGDFPYAEVAKSGRSSCLVCKKKIEKDTVRVAIERKIETAGFSGVRPGYLHRNVPGGTKI